VLAVIGETLAPRILIPNHVHRNDVWVRVESGEIGVLVGDEVRTARAGEWALKPRDIEHAMWNPTDEPATASLNRRAEACADSRTKPEPSPPACPPGAG
jgi:quercetin dioxygenase-like cupin family protein